MIIGEEHFRKLYRSLIIIKDKSISHEIAKNMLLSTIWDDDLSDEDIKEKLESLQIDESINSILVIPYIDHTAGMSFHFLTTAIIDNENVKIIKRDDFTAMINIRKDKVIDLEFEYLENLNVNADFNLGDYSESIDIVNNYARNEDVETLRFVEILDDARHEDFPDDVGVLFLKDDCDLEKLWVRYEKVIEAPLIEGKLLNTPFQDFGVSEGDNVRFFPYKDEEHDEILLICNFESKK